MMLTLFEQTVPMSNFAYYKADTDEALNSLNDVLSYPVDQSKQSLVTKQSNVYNIRMYHLVTNIKKYQRYQY